MIVIRNKDNKLDIFKDVEFCGKRIFRVFEERENFDLDCNATKQDVKDCLDFILSHKIHFVDDIEVDISWVNFLESTFENWDELKDKGLL